MGDVLDWDFYSRGGQGGCLDGKPVRTLWGASWVCAPLHMAFTNKSSVAQIDHISVNCDVQCSSVQCWIYNNNSTNI